MKFSLIKFNDKYLWSRVALVFGIIFFILAAQEGANYSDHGRHYYTQALALFFGSTAFISRKKQKFGGTKAWLFLESPSIFVIFIAFSTITYQQIELYPLSCLIIIGSIITWALIMVGRK